MKKRFVLSPLMRKLIRDLRDGWKSFVAIFVICLLAVTLYAGIDATWRAIDRSVEEQFETSDMADIWVRGATTDRAVRDISAVDGVMSAQRRVLAESKAEGLLGQPKVMLLANDGPPIVNKPLLSGGGELPTKKNACVLQERFAGAHGLSVGDSFQVTYGSHVIALTVEALGVMPEYVVTSDGGEMAASPSRYGYAWVTEGTLGFLPYQEVAVKLLDRADVGQVKRDIQTLFEDQTVVVSEREDIFGIKMAMEEAQQVRAMGAIFPVVFFVIAALITWTTMSRLVENQRLQIGSLFALGYGKRELLWHYAGYGLLIAVFGVLGGLLGARYVIAPIIMGFIDSLYVLPGAVPTLSPMVVMAVGVIIGFITGGAGVLSAVSALQRSPASLLRPKPPGKGKRVFIERVTFIWKRLSFSAKMILRNMFRNRIRLLMGLIGAAGCTAMMLTGFGMRDSVDYVISNHYTRTMHYDLRATLSQDAPTGYGESIALRAGATALETEMITGLEAYVSGEWKSKPVFVLQDNHDMIHLFDNGGNRVILPSRGVALTQKAAEEMDKEVGGTLELRQPAGRGVTADIVQIIDLQLDQGVYMSRSAFDKLGIIPFRPSAILFRGPDMDVRAIADMDGVAKVRTLAEESRSNATMLDIMNVIVVIMVLFSGTLALVVFYNLGQLNFSERIRELATLKVLGFTPGEIKKLVLRENILITLLGLPIGLFFGPILHNTVLTHGLPNTIQFVPYISLVSWAATIVLTICFSLVVNGVLGFKFKEINMVEALKSVE